MTYRKMHRIRQFQTTDDTVDATIYIFDDDFFEADGYATVRISRIFGEDALGNTVFSSDAGVTYDNRPIEFTLGFDVGVDTSQLSGITFPVAPVAGLGGEALLPPDILLGTGVGTQVLGLLSNVDKTINWTVELDITFVPATVDLS